MSEQSLQKQLESLRKKLNNAQKQNAALKVKAEMYDTLYADTTRREVRASDLVKELVERQKELNLMLYRANAIIGRAQEAMALSSSEMTEMTKMLPEPKRAEWNDRVSKINDLFNKTGIRDAEIKETPKADTAEMTENSEESFGKERTEVSTEAKATGVSDATEAEFRQAADLFRKTRPEIKDAEIVENPPEEPAKEEKKKSKLLFWKK